MGAGWCRLFTIVYIYTFIFYSLRNYMYITCTDLHLS
nr:MAG TPA: hypothetical protein [Caudoviricetes sp.]